MTILGDWNLQKSNARMYLLTLYRELREVLESDLLLNEKEHLFCRTHRNDIVERSWLVRPDLYKIGSYDLTGPTHPREGKGEARLLSYLNELGEILEYSKHRAELLAAVHDVAAVMDLDLPISEDSGLKRCGARKDEFKGQDWLVILSRDTVSFSPIRSPGGGWLLISPLTNTEKVRWVLRNGDLDFNVISRGVVE